jgi:gliding motility-associated-like protein
MTTIRPYFTFLVLFALYSGTAFARTDFLTGLPAGWNIAPPDTCPNHNFPAPPGDSCKAAPLFCGNYLDGYCSSNTGATPDSSFNLNGFNCFPIENNVWLRFATCESNVKLEITPRNCQKNLGLESGLFAGSCSSLSALASCITLPPNQPDTLTFSNLFPQTEYWLMIDGVQGDVCDFSIRVISGIGTAPPPPTHCDCIPGYVDGPPSVCTGNQASYVLRLPSCAIIPDSVTGGNGLYCPPPPDVCPTFKDTILVSWHIPQWLSFIGDSTGLTINTTPNPAYLGYDTIIFHMDTVVIIRDTTLFGTILVNVTTLFSPDSTQLDSLAFCDCQKQGGCAGTILPFPVSFHHEHKFYHFTLTCAHPTVYFDGQPISAEGIYVSNPDACHTNVLTVDALKGDPPFAVQETDLGNGTYVVNLTGLDGNSTVTGLTGTQTSTNYTSIPIPCGSPYTLTITDSITGCTATATGNLHCPPCVKPAINIQPTAPFISCCATPLLNLASDQTISTVLWQSPGGQTSGTPSLPANLPGLYTVTVTVNDGCSSTATIQMFANQNPPIITLPSSVTICQGASTTVTANAIGNNLVYQWNTGNLNAQITVQPMVTTEYQVTVTNSINCCTKTASTTVDVQPIDVQDVGVVGTVGCNNPCFVYNGTSYCAPGDYQQTQSNCTLLKFKITFQKDIVDLGNLATLTCYNPCFVRNGISYCQPGTYAEEDSCHIYQFKIDENKKEPEILNLAQVCTPSNTSYVVSFQINGQSPFYVNGSPIAGTSYLSDPVPSGTNYVFIVKSGPTGCETIVSGTFSCDFLCGNTAGTMDNKPIHACVNGLAVSTYLGDAVLAQGDIGLFILYTGDPLNGGQVFAQNSSGQFTIPGGIQPGQTYYIAHVVGKDTGNGTVDLANGCTKISAGQPVVFYKVPTKPAVSIQQPRCLYGASATGQITILTTTGSWAQFTIDGYPGQAVNTFDNLPVGAHILTSIDSNTCRVSDTIEIHAPVNPLVVDLGPEKSTNPCSPIELDATTNGIPTSVQWSTDGGETYAGGIKWMTAFQFSRKVTLVITDTAGCIASDSVSVQISDNHLAIPNVFTPNGDGLNDEFKLIIRCPVEDFHFLIFDRWGQRVFETTNQEAAWNGLVRMKEAPSDLYDWWADYVVEQAGQRVPVHLKGGVTLLR